MISAESETKSAGPAAEAAKMTKPQKLAALLVMLGPESASQVLKTLEPPEIEAISGEMTKYSMISQELQAEILKEFSGMAVQASTGVRGGVDFTRSVLEKAFGVFRAAEVIGRVSPQRTPVAAMQEIVDMEPRQIFNLIRHEQPQAVALILSYVAADKAAETLTFFHQDQRDKILERIATLAPTPIEVVEQVVQVLIAKRGSNQTRVLNQTGGVKTAADLLNAMDKNQGKALLVTLEERNPELGTAIRQKMFTFEDLVQLETAALQRILREIDMRDLAVALKTASDKLKTSLLQCISKRAAETVQEEMNFMGPVRLREIEGAQLRIIDIVRKLESDGDIDLGETRKQSQYEMV
jgi:flagellar motor switch protein FliG